MKAIFLSLFFVMLLPIHAQTVPAVRQDQDATRLLYQATFGPAYSDIIYARRLSREQWIDEQMDLPMSSQLDALLSLDIEELDASHRMQVWWSEALEADDQLRQRVAFALSQILVVSETGSILGDYPQGTAFYYDLLLEHAFGNFRDLLEAVTLSPAMGLYLSMLGNQKPDEVAGIRADENYAREIMQLFTIGLIELNQDGTPRLTDQGETIPTYNQSDIENLARVFTGWTTAETQEWYEPEEVPDQFMIAFEDFHDVETKVIVGETLIPAGGTAYEDLTLALDTLFNHDNTGPFIVKQLIQRLVTSNPSPAYVQRVSEIFADNGDGVRGDLSAVVKGILLDEEARTVYPDDQSFGKLREPLIRLTHLWRATRAGSESGLNPLEAPEFGLAQGALRSPSVFNFYRPDYAPAGQIAAAGLLAPEFQITNENTLINMSNYLMYFTQFSFWSLAEAGFTDENSFLIQVQYESKIAHDPYHLAAYLDLVFFAGVMPESMQTILVEHIESIPYWLDGVPPGVLRTVDAIWLVVSSPQYAIQR